MTRAIKRKVAMSREVEGKGVTRETQKETRPDEVLAGQTVPLNDLPDHLIERIVPLMGFPEMFKFRCVSTMWRNRFLPIADLHNKEEKALAKSFQADVLKEAKHLGVFFPVFITTDYMSSLTYSFAFDWTSKNWKRVPSMLSFLPMGADGISSDIYLTQTRTVVAGIVFLSRASNLEEPIIVANIFTRSWKKLPHRPGLVPSYLCLDLCKERKSGRNRAVSSFHEGSKGRIIRLKFVRDALVVGYKVIAVFETWCECDIAFHCFANICNSITNAWTITKLPPGPGVLSRKCEYLDGVFYSTSMDVQSLFAVDAEGGSTKILQFTFVSPPETLLGYEHIEHELVVWDGQFFMLYSSLRHIEIEVRIWKVNVPSLELMEVTRGPSAAFRDNLHRLTLSFLIEDGLTRIEDYGRMEFHFFDGQRMFFRQNYGFVCPMVVYDLLNNEWSWLKCPPVQIERGMEDVPMHIVQNLAVRREMYNLHNRKDLPLARFDPFWQV